MKNSQILTNLSVQTSEFSNYKYSLSKAHLELITHSLISFIYNHF